MIGRKFGRWTVIAKAANRHNRFYWLCQCECGTQSECAGGALRGGRTLSCGCWQRERASRAAFKHGMIDTKDYGAWAAMLRRCKNRNDPHWKDYGGRGITVCERWNDFMCFYEDMGARPRGTSLDRVDNNKGYSKDNCRWATQIQQARNTRNNNIIEFNGTAQSLAAWAEQLGMKQQTLCKRLKHGWAIERALTYPVQSQFGPQTGKTGRLPPQPTRPGADKEGR